MFEAKTFHLEDSEDFSDSTFVSIESVQESIEIGFTCVTGMTATEAVVTKNKEKKILSL